MNLRTFEELIAEEASLKSDTDSINIAKMLVKESKRCVSAERNKRLIDILYIHYNDSPKHTNESGKESFELLSIDDSGSFLPLNCTDEDKTYYTTDKFSSDVQSFETMLESSLNAFLKRNKIRGKIVTEVPDGDKIVYYWELSAK